MSFSDILLEATPIRDNRFESRSKRKSLAQSDNRLRLMTVKIQVYAKQNKKTLFYYLSCHFVSFVVTEWKSTLTDYHFM